MKVDGRLNVGLIGAADAAATMELAGYSGLWAAETAHDPFLPLLLAAEHTARIEIGTSIAVAFARNPMTLANLGWDLQTYSQGRFVLGLGSQVEAHITRRFSMPWDRPAERMRELVLAIRAIWDSWKSATQLDFRGEFYTHTLMTPFFSPAAGELESLPRIFLAGVGEAMTVVAGEVADGFICHSFTTERYLREVTLPALRRGRARVGQTLEGFEIVGPSFVAIGGDSDEVARAADATRRQIAFYGSTPAYRGVLELHDWGSLQPLLHGQSKAGEWDAMAQSVPEEVLHAFAVVGTPGEIAPELRRRYGDVIQRINFYSPYETPGRYWARVIDDLSSGE